MFIQAVRLGFPTASIMIKTASNTLSSTLLHGTTKADVTGGKANSRCERSRVQQHCQIELLKNNRITNITCACMWGRCHKIHKVDKRSANHA